MWILCTTLKSRWTILMYVWLIISLFMVIDDLSLQLCHHLSGCKMPQFTGIFLKKSKAVANMAWTRFASNESPGQKSIAMLMNSRENLDVLQAGSIFVKYVCLNILSIENKLIKSSCILLFELYYICSFLHLESLSNQ